LAPWLYRLALTQALQYRRNREMAQVDHTLSERLRPLEFESRATDPLEWLLADERQAVGSASHRGMRGDAEICC